MATVKLWLDDVRQAPEGWRWAQTVEMAKVTLQLDEVLEASLDHDLGACETCLNGRTMEQWFLDTGVMPNCDHIGTGYDLVKWMAETGRWPKTKPVVHSMNPVGAARMRGTIERYFVEPDMADAVIARD